MQVLSANLKSNRSAKAARSLARLREMMIPSAEKMRSASAVEAWMEKTLTLTNITMSYKYYILT